MNGIDISYIYEWSYVPKQCLQVGNSQNLQGSQILASGTVFIKIQGKTWKVPTLFIPFLKFLLQCFQLLSKLQYPVSAVGFNFVVLHELHEIRHSVTSYFMNKHSKRCCDTSTPESIHTKDESKRGSAFAFIFGVNWPIQWM